MNNSPFNNYFFANENLMVSKAKGDITFQDMVNHFNILTKDKNYVQGINAVYNLMHCTDIDGEIEVLNQFGSMLNDLIVIPNKSKTAILIPENNQKIIRK